MATSSATATSAPALLWEREIPGAAIPVVQGALAGLAKACAKLGFAPPTIVVEEGALRGDTQLFLVRVEGELPVARGGWEFRGALDWLGASGERFVRAVPGADSLNFAQFATPLCQHCGRERNRRRTFIFQNAGGDLLQVGSSCMRDFWGHDFAPALATFLEEVAGAEDSAYYGRVSSIVAISTVMEAAQYWIARKGWMSGAKASQVQEESGRKPISTKDWVEDELSGRPDEATKFILELYPQTEEEGKLWEGRTEQAIAWVKAQDSAASTYIANLQALLRIGYVDMRAPGQLGLLVSLIPSWQREMDKKAREAVALPSSHYGQVGEKFKGLQVTFSGCSSFATQYGSMAICRFTLATGEILVWKTSSGEPDLERGQACTLAGTVKAHSEFRGALQTEVLRVKIS